MQHVDPPLSVPIQIQPEQRTPLHILRCQQLLLTVNHIAPAPVELRPLGPIDEGKLSATILTG